MFKVLAGILLVIIPKASEFSETEPDKNNHNFSIAHAVVFVTISEILLLSDKIFK